MFRSTLLVFFMLAGTDSLGAPSSFHIKCGPAPTYTDPNQFETVAVGCSLLNAAETELIPGSFWIGMRLHYTQSGTVTSRRPSFIPGGETHHPWSVVMQLRFEEVITATKIEALIQTNAGQEWFTKEKPFEIFRPNTIPSPLAFRLPNLQANQIGPVQTFTMPASSTIPRENMQVTGVVGTPQYFHVVGGTCFETIENPIVGTDLPFKSKIKGDCTIQIQAYRPPGHHRGATVNRFFTMYINYFDGSSMNSSYLTFSYYSTR